MSGQLSFKKFCENISLSSHLRFVALCSEVVRLSGWLELSVILPSGCNILLRDSLGFFCLTEFVHHIAVINKKKVNCSLNFFL